MFIFNGFIEKSSIFEKYFHLNYNVLEVFLGNFILL